MNSLTLCLQILSLHFCLNDRVYLTLFVVYSYFVSLFDFLSMRVRACECEFLCVISPPRTTSWLIVL